jgi:hypothetical protein
MQLYRKQRCSGNQQQQSCHKSLIRDKIKRKLPSCNNKKDTDSQIKVFHVFFLKVIYDKHKQGKKIDEDKSQNEIGEKPGPEITVLQDVVGKRHRRREKKRKYYYCNYWRVQFLDLDIGREKGADKERCGAENFSEKSCP